MTIKKAFIYVLNVVFALAMGYVYVGATIQSFAVLCLLTLLATYLAILNHQKNKTKKVKFCLDLLLSFSVPMFFTFSFLILGSIIDIFQKVDLGIGFSHSTLLYFLISFMSGIYALPAWLSWGIVNYFVINRIVKIKV